MQISINLTPDKMKTPLEIAQALRAMADTFAPGEIIITTKSAPAGAPEITHETPKKKRGRPAKALKTSGKKPNGPDDDESEEIPETDEAETDETPPGDFEDEDNGTEDDEEKQSSAFSIDEVREQLKTYAKKNGRDEAMKILNKFGVKLINDLKPKQFANVMKEAKL